MLVEVHNRECVGCVGGSILNTTTHTQHQQAPGVTTSLFSNPNTDSGQSAHGDVEAVSKATPVLL